MAITHSSPHVNVGKEKSVYDSLQAVLQSLRIKTVEDLTRSFNMKQLGLRSRQFRGPDGRPYVVASIYTSPEAVARLKTKPIKSQRPQIELELVDGSSCDSPKVTVIVAVKVAPTSDKIVGPDELAALIKENIYLMVPESYVVQSDVSDAEVEPPKLTKDFGALTRYYSILTDDKSSKNRIVSTVRRIGYLLHAYLPKDRKDPAYLALLTSEQQLVLKFIDFLVTSMEDKVLNPDHEFYPFLLPILDQLLDGNYKNPQEVYSKLAELVQDLMYKNKDFHPKNYLQIKYRNALKVEQFDMNFPPLDPQLKKEWEAQKRYYEQLIDKAISKILDGKELKWQIEALSAVKRPFVVKPETTSEDIVRYFTADGATSSAKLEEGKPSQSRSSPSSKPNYDKQVRNDGLEGHVEKGTEQNRQSIFPSFLNELLSVDCIYSCQNNASDHLADLDIDMINSLEFRYASVRILHLRNRSKLVLRKLDEEISKFDDIIVHGEIQYHDFIGDLGDTECRRVKVEIPLQLVFQSLFCLSETTQRSVIEAMLRNKCSRMQFLFNPIHYGESVRFAAVLIQYFNSHHPTHFSVSSFFNSNFQYLVKFAQAKILKLFETVGYDVPMISADNHILKPGASYTRSVYTPAFLPSLAGRVAISNWTPAVIAYTIYERFWKFKGMLSEDIRNLSDGFYNSLCGQIKSYHVLSVDEALNETLKRCAKSRDKLAFQQAAELIRHTPDVCSLLGSPGITSVIGKLLAFPKLEAVDESGKKARLIFFRDHVDRLIQTMVFHPIADILHDVEFKATFGVDNEVSFGPFSNHIIKGLKPIQIQERFKELQSKQASAYLQTDWSAFERVASLFREKENLIYQTCLKLCGSDTAHYVKFVLREVSYSGPVTDIKSGTKFEIPSMRKSGEGETGWFNTWTNAVLTVCLIMSIGCRVVDFLVEGDDGCFAIEHPGMSLEEANSRLRELVSSLNLPLKSEFVTNAMDLEFCSMKFDLAGHLTSDPCARLLKMFTILQNKFIDSDKHLKNALYLRSLSLLHQYSYVPVVTEIARTIVESVQVDNPTMEEYADSFFKFREDDDLQQSYYDFIELVKKGEPQLVLNAYALEPNLGQLDEHVKQSLANDVSYVNDIDRASKWAIENDFSKPVEDWIQLDLDLSKRAPVISDFKQPKTFKQVRREAHALALQQTSGRAFNRFVGFFNLDSEKMKLQALSFLSGLKTYARALFLFLFLPIMAATWAFPIVMLPLISALLFVSALITILGLIKRNGTLTGVGFVVFSTLFVVPTVLLKRLYGISYLMHVYNKLSCKMANSTRDRLSACRRLYHEYCANLSKFYNFQLTEERQALLDEAIEKVLGIHPRELLLDSCDRLNIDVLSRGLSDDYLCLGIFKEFVYLICSTRGDPNASNLNDYAITHLFDKLNLHFNVPFVVEPSEGAISQDYYESF